METADAERQRIERDLHDSIQQDLVGLRLKLDMVAEAVGEDPQSAQLMLGSLGNQMDDVLEALRSMARGVYPSLLRERGLADALRSAARRAPLPVIVDARALGRYPEDLETAVYFCCLEALQNAIKHAGHEATVDIRLREDSGALAFQVRDTGQGFDPGHANGRHGLLNMQDRRSPGCELADGLGHARARASASALTAAVQTSPALASRAAARARSVGGSSAPTIQNSGMKKPMAKNAKCPLRSAVRPSHTSAIRYRTPSSTSSQVAIALLLVRAISPLSVSQPVRRHKAART